LIVMSADEAKRRGFVPLAKLGAFVATGVDPEIMGIGPVPAVQELLRRRGLNLDDFDLVELNEAFAAQVLACDRELHFAKERLNVNGGSIALGHPIGCTGARILVTLLHEMKRRASKRGLATLCVSGGLGLALEVERSA
jgi:acetyl-CoA C-acetyltransferase